MVEEDRKLIHTYEISQKNFYEVLPLWRIPSEIKEGIVELNSLEKVSDYLSTYYSERSWKLIKEKVTNKRTIYTFKSIPDPDSDAARNPGRFTPHIIKVKIKSKISLENKLEGDKK